MASLSTGKSCSCMTNIYEVCLKNIEVEAEFIKKMMNKEHNVAFL